MKKRPIWKKLAPVVLTLSLLAALACNVATAPSAEPTQQSQSAAATDDNEGVVTQASLDVSATAQADAPESPARAPQQQVEPENETVDLTPDQIVEAFETAINTVYEDSIDSVVHIRVAQTLSTSGNEFTFPFGAPGEGDLPDLLPSGEGSGFVWDDQGHIVTNRHVVQDADRVTVTFANGVVLEAEVLGADPDSDLAVLQVDLPDDMQISPIRLGSSAEARVGQTAIAIGNPFGQEFTVTSGIVSAIGRVVSSGSSQFSIPEVIQTDAAINPGNSGGPLLNRKGEVIGINTQIISRSGSNSGIGFAVPIDVARQVVPALIEDGRFEYAWLGISGAQLSRDVAAEMDIAPSTGGVLVIETAQGGPADRAGVQASDRIARISGTSTPVGGDVIVAVEDTPILDMNDLIAYLVVNTRPGDTITLHVVHDGGTESDIEVVLGTRP